MLQNPLSARGPAQFKSGPEITCLVSVTIYCAIFQKRFASPVFTHKMLFKKYLGKMLIEQNIAIELRGPGPPGRTCTPVTG